jgi:hypothetical protein
MRKELDFFKKTIEEIAKVQTSEEQIKGLIGA